MTDPAATVERGTEELYVLIPCLNEERSVESAAREILATADTLPIPVQILLIDDGSADGTRTVMERLAQGDERVHVRVNAENRGLGRSVIDVLAGLPPTAWVTVFPGDNEFVASSIHNFLEVRGDYDLILGYLNNPVIRTLGRRIASAIFGKVVSTLYGFPWRYLNGLKMYRASVFQGLEITSTGHSYMAEAIAKAQLRSPDLRIGEVPFFSRGRGSGQSKAIKPSAVLKALTDVFRGSRAVSRYRKRVVTGREE
jgi:glycosyltransferase involved in cell wall biosynthesis